MRLVGEGLVKRFGARVVLDDVCATIEPGRLTMLVGPSGSGKTTLMGVLAGYVVPDAGTVVIEGGGADVIIRDHVAWVPQGANALPARTALDNVAIGPLAAGRSRVDAERLSLEALESVQLSTRAHARAKTLSGGELQRVAFARAVASQRQFVFADEPTSSLDAANTELVCQALDRLRSLATVVVATHDPQLIAHADVVIALRAS